MSAKPIVLIGCGKAKRRQGTEAADLYTGALFTDRLAYAEARALEEERWIVSAKHGLVGFEEWVEPYDLTIDDLDPVARAAFYPAVVISLLEALWPDTGDAGAGTYHGVRIAEVRIELHMGADYAEPLLEVLRAIGFRAVSWPVRGLGIGEQRAWYANALRALALGAVPAGCAS